MKRNMILFGLVAGCVMNLIGSDVESKQANDVAVQDTVVTLQGQLDVVVKHEEPVFLVATETERESLLGAIVEAVHAQPVKKGILNTQIDIMLHAFRHCAYWAERGLNIYHYREAHMLNGDNFLRPLEIYEYSYIRDVGFCKAMELVRYASDEFVSNKAFRDALIVRMITEANVLKRAIGYSEDAREVYDSTHLPIDFKARVLLSEHLEKHPFLVFLGIGCLGSVIIVISEIILRQKVLTK